MRGTIRAAACADTVTLAITRRMTTRGFLCALAMALALGCRAPATETRWMRTRESAEPLEAARAACKTQALERSKDTARNEFASKQAVGVFAECMRQRGWELAEVAERPAR